MGKRIIGLILAVAVLLTSAAWAETASVTSLTWKRTVNHMLKAQEAPILVNDASFYYRDNISKVKSYVKRMNKLLDAAKVTHPDVTYYVYFVESPRTYHVTEPITGPSATYEYIAGELHADRFDRLKPSSVEELCSWFWTTDQHWNHKGVYQAYQDIMALLGSEDELAVPRETRQFPVIFNGSLAKDLKKPISEEYFTVYLYDGIPSYTTYVNGKKKQHDGIENYLKGLYAQGTYTDHYSAYYGPNQGEVIYDTGNTDKPNILVIQNSFGNPINQLLTLHYGKVITVNLKHYRNGMKKNFDLDAYLDEYDIDQVLFMGDVSLYVHPNTVR